MSSKSSSKSKGSSSTGSSSSSSQPNRTGPSYEETVVHGKKRKVWRSTNTANMMSPEAAANYLQQAAEAAAAAAASAQGGESVQITLGPNGIAAHTTAAAGVGMESLHWMNPNFAAAAGSRAAGSSSTGATAGGSHFNNPLAGMGVNMNMSMNLNTNSVSFGNLDLAALAKAGDLSALTNAAARHVTSSSNTNNASSSLSSSLSSPLDASLRKASAAPLIPGTTGAKAGGKDSLPCSEAEMKALMSMFVEIMGMSMDTEKLGKSTAAKKRAAKAKKNGDKSNSSSSTSSSNLFSFGDDKNGVWPDPAIAAATGDLDALKAHRCAYSDDDDEDEDDSLPDLDDMKQVQEERQKQQLASGTNGSDSKAKTGASSLILTNSNPTPITGRTGIAPVEWESLEQVAIEDAMEAEERARKAAKRREKKNRKKEKDKKEAAAIAAEAAAKKQEKAILSWRSRVVSACQSNEVEKLETLLEESPLTSTISYATGDVDATPITVATMTPHLEFLLPHTVAKNRTLAERKNDARTKLAQYLMNTNLPLVFTTPLRTGRTALHTACLHGEIDFVQHALHLAQNWTQEAELSILPSNYLQMSCQESGFAPIHYAVLSGVKPVLETLLEAGADVKLKSTDTHTWKSSTGKGISPRELAETISHGSQDKVMETHGLALQEAISHYSSSNDEKRKYRTVLERMVERLKDVEQHGYSPPPPEPEVIPEEPKVAKAEIETVQDTNDEDSEEPEAIELQPVVEDSNSNKNVKKKKKKKKKGQQQAAESDNTQNAQSITGKNLAAAAEPNSVSAQDPLVVALLGMGFTEEQIGAAVKACGGTDRATADDLVVWILGEGSGEAIVEPAPAPSQPRPAAVPRNMAPSIQAPAPTPAPPPFPAMPKQPTSQNKPKAKEPLPAVSETRAAKAAAKKEEEARLKEQRLAAKREEKIRKNREWNERAQTRQKDEENAKIAQAVADANRVATQRAAQAAAVQQQQQYQQHLQQQAQQQSRQQQSQQPQPLAAHHGLAPASAFFPGGVGATAAPGMMPLRPHAHGPSLNMGMPPPPPGHYGMPMPPPSVGYAGPGRLTPQGTAGNMLDAASRMIEAQQAAHAHVRAQSYDSNYNQLPPHAPPGMQKMGPPQGWEPPSNHGHMYSNNTDMSSYPSIPDDSTVSSYGSGRISVPSNFSATLPPGFRPTPTPSTLPPPMEESASVTSYEDNHLGEMRATAREFVPTFGSRPTSRNASSLRHTSSLPGAPSASVAPAPAAEPPKTSRLPALAMSDVQSAPAMSSGMHPSGLIGGVNDFGSSLLAPPPAPGLHLTSSLVGVSTEHFSPVPRSAASSVTGIPNADEPQLPAGLGLERGISDAATKTPATLETMTPANLPSPSFDNSAGRPGASLWGGMSSGSRVVAAAGNASSGVAGIPLTGLPSLSLTSGSPTGSNLGPRSDALSGEALLPSGLGGAGTWGSSNLGAAGATGGNNANAGGSIW